MVAVYRPSGFAVNRGAVNRGFTVHNILLPYTDTEQRSYNPADELLSGQSEFEDANYEDVEEASQSPVSTSFEGTAIQDSRIGELQSGTEDSELERDDFCTVNSKNNWK